MPRPRTDICQVSRLTSCQNVRDEDREKDDERRRDGTRRQSYHELLFEIIHKQRRPSCVIFAFIVVYFITFIPLSKEK